MKPFSRQKTTRSLQPCKPVRRTVSGVINHDPPVAALPLIDIGGALDVLAAAVGECFMCMAGQHQTCLYTTPAAPQRLVGRALSLAHVADVELQQLGARDVRALYSQGSLPVRLTFGAMAVLDAAQRGQDGGYTCGEVLESAIGVAVRFLDLMPDTAFDPNHRRPDRSNALSWIGSFSASSRQASGADGRGPGSAGGVR